jgi:hypothetical protein
MPAIVLGPHSHPEGTIPSVLRRILFRIILKDLHIFCVDETVGSVLLVHRLSGRILHLVTMSLWQMSVTLSQMG